MAEITDAELAELRRLHEAADRAPWYLVGHPWADGRAADTYAISGSPDPHAGTAVLQWCEVDEVTLRDGDDESSAWRDAEDKQRANLACAVGARNALPALLSRLERADARIATLEAALRPFAKFADAWDAHPINSLSDDLYSIHSGDIGAALRLSDIKCARSALRGLEGK